MRAAQRIASVENRADSFDISRRTILQCGVVFFAPVLPVEPADLPNRAKNVSIGLLKQGCSTKWG
jgi:hypothetical protein